jgi:uncharacterized sulfatase
MLNGWKVACRHALGLALLQGGIGTEATARVERLERPPNLVLIVGDDHGWPYAGFMGNDIVQTPNLDALAAEGTVFTHVFASASVCRPTLRTLLSGLDRPAWEAQHERTNTTFGPALPPRFEVRRFQTLPRQLARRGYISFQAGKYWEGSSPRAGFSAGTATSIGRGFFEIVGDDFARPSLEPLTNFLDTVGEAPFFLWLAPKIPHTPLDPAPELQAPYRALGLVEPAVLYYANVTRLDQVVEAMRDELRARGLDRNTLIVYVSDNGWEQAPDESHFLGSVLGGPRGKASIYELGYRAPTIFHWPGRVPGGRREAALATFEDLNATLLDYAGVALPPDHEGASLRRHIETGRGRGRDVVFGSTDFLRVREDEFVPGRGPGGLVRFESAAYIRTREWRYVSYLDRGEHELYRIASDPFEDFNVADDYPHIAARLAARLAAELERRARPAPVVELAGRLRTFLGVPIDGMPLHLSGVDAAGQAIELRGTTADDGSFRLPNVPAGHYTLTLPEGRLVYEAQLLTEVPVDLTGLQTGPFLDLRAIELSETRPRAESGDSEIHATFVDRRGRPLAGLPVQLDAWEQAGDLHLRLLTGPDGSVSLDRLPRSLYLQTPGEEAGPGGRYFFLPDAARLKTRMRIRCTPEGECSPLRR